MATKYTKKRSKSPGKIYTTRKRKYQKGGLNTMPEEEEIKTQGRWHKTGKVFNFAQRDARRKFDTAQKKLEDASSKLLRGEDAEGESFEELQKQMGEATADFQAEKAKMGKRKEKKRKHNGERLKNLFDETLSEDNRTKARVLVDYIDHLQSSGERTKMDDFLTNAFNTQIQLNALFTVLILSRGYTEIIKDTRALLVRMKSQSDSHLQRMQKSGLIIILPDYYKIQEDVEKTEKRMQNSPFTRPWYWTIDAAKDKINDMLEQTEFSGRIFPAQFRALDREGGEAGGEIGRQFISDTYTNIVMKDIIRDILNLYEEPLNKIKAKFPKPIKEYYEILLKEYKTKAEGQHPGLDEVMHEALKREEAAREEAAREEAAREDAGGDDDDAEVDAPTGTMLERLRETARGVRDGVRATLPTLPPFGVETEVDKLNKLGYTALNAALKALRLPDKGKTRDLAERLAAAREERGFGPAHPEEEAKEDEGEEEVPLPPGRLGAAFGTDDTYVFLTKCANAEAPCNNVFKSVKGMIVKNITVGGQTYIISPSAAALEKMTEAQALENSLQKLDNTVDLLKAFSEGAGSNNRKMVFAPHPDQNSARYIEELAKGGGRRSKKRRSRSYKKKSRKLRRIRKTRSYKKKSRKLRRTRRRRR